MAKKDYFLIVDTETTQDSLVADFGAVIVDRKGRIQTQCAVLVHGVYTNEQDHPLFHIFGDSGDIWSRAGLPKRYERYNSMLTNGTRQLASVAAINIWLAKARATYNPYCTAYNLSFDADKCAKTGIDLAQFADRQFCLWHAAFTKWANTKAYKNFALSQHAFNAPTRHGNMSFKTNAEVMARFVTGNPQLEDEPHTALEDVLYYELPILLKLVATTKKQQWLNPTPFNWRDVQVKDNFKAN